MLYINNFMNLNKNYKSINILYALLINSLNCITHSNLWSVYHQITIIELVFFLQIKKIGAWNVLSLSLILDNKCYNIIYV